MNCGPRPHMYYGYDRYACIVLTHVPCPQYMNVFLNITSIVHLLMTSRRRSAGGGGAKPFQQAASLGVCLGGYFLWGRSAPPFLGKRSPCHYAVLACMPWQESNVQMWVRWQVHVGRHLQRLGVVLCTIVEW